MLPYICRMYSRQEASQIKQEFWTSFGQYMAPILSSEGEKINWVNYKTGQRQFSIRLTADNRQAGIYLELSHKDTILQQLYFEQLVALKHLLPHHEGLSWQWQLLVPNDQGRTVSRIFDQLYDVSIFRKEDWPGLISFFKQRIILLDEFWNRVKYGIEAIG